MTDALIVGDVHLSDRAPSSRKDTYADEILAKLRWCSIYANHPGPGQGPVPMVISGDVFHIKTPWRTSYGLVQRVHDVLETVEMGVYIVPGNHDVSHDRLESLASQPLGALCRMGNVALLADELITPGVDPVLPKIKGIPWHREFDGGDWESVVRGYLESWREDGDVPQLVVTHAPLFPPGQEPGVYNSIPADVWAGVMGEAGVAATYYGHIHEQHGWFEVPAPTPTDQGVTHLFCNNGALSRGSLHEESVKRWPTVTYWSAEHTAFHPVPLGEEVVKPPEEVFLFEQAAEQRTKESMTQAFEEALGEVKLANLTTEEVLAYVRKEDVPPKVLTVIESVLEQVL